MYGRVRLGAVAVALSLIVAACDDTTGIDDGARVTLAFSTVAPTASAQSSSAADVVVAGTNGSLVITDIRFIVSELRLERSEDACEGLVGDDDVDDDDDDCEKFETGLEFVQLPLTGATAAIVTETVPAGTYTELKFEVADADHAEAQDGDDAGEITTLRQQIAAAGFTDWPDDASLVVIGTFTPTDGEPRPFRAYLDAEIRIELTLDPAIVIDGENGTVDVVIDPMMWFSNVDGTIIDLSQFDFATTGEILEFEAKLVHGFTKIELEGFED